MLVQNLPLFKKSFVEISLDEENQVVIAKWIGFLRLEDVKQGCEEVNRLLSKHKLSKHLSDHTQLKVLSKDVQEYLTQKWFSDAEALGLRKLAVQMAEDVFAQASVSKVNMQASVRSLQIHNFNSYTQCYGWLNA